MKRINESSRIPKRNETNVNNDNEKLIKIRTNKILIQIRTNNKSKILTKTSRHTRQRNESSCFTEFLLQLLIKIKSPKESLRRNFIKIPQNLFKNSIRQLVPVEPTCGHLFHTPSRPLRGPGTFVPRYHGWE